MFRSVSIAAVAAVLGLAACAPEIPPDPKPSDGFTGADLALVDGACAEVLKAFPEPERVVYRAPVISETAEQGRAVCIDAAMPGELWKGFVVRPAFSGFEVREELDTLSPKARPQCRALVLKYLGEQDIDWYEAEVAFNKAGCAHLDAGYWGAWKESCNGKTTRPAKTPKPAA